MEESTVCDQGRDMVQVEGALVKAGIDVKRLECAVKRLRTEERGCMNIYEFRRFWKVIFPENVFDTAAWDDTERIFVAIDEDQDMKVNMAEILRYLDRERRNQEKIIKGPPGNISELVWYFISSVSLWSDTADHNPALRNIVLTYRWLSQTAVLISCIIILIDSLPENHDDKQQGSSFVIESCCVGLFTAEFVAWCLVYPRGFHSFVKDWSTWVDVITITPFYISLLLTNASVFALGALRVLRLFRLIRTLETLKGGSSHRFSRIPELVDALAKASRPFVWALMLISLVLIGSSSFMFYAEKEEASFNREERAWYRDNNSRYLDAGERIPFQSIFEALWWSIVTLTTVGYGDYVPRTIGGKVVGAVTMLTGLIIVGYLITVVNNSFVSLQNEIDKKYAARKRMNAFFEGTKSWLDSTTDESPQSPTLTISHEDPMALSITKLNHRINTMVSLMTRKDEGDNNPQWAATFENIITMRFQTVQTKIDKLKDRVDALDKSK